MIVIRFKFLCSEIITAKAGRRGADPQNGIIIDNKAGDVVAAERGRIIDTIPEDIEIATIIAVKTIFRSEPHKSYGIAHHAGDAVIGKTVFRGNLFE